jgi:glycolate oxidase FAD binding subunit
VYELLAGALGREHVRPASEGDAVDGIQPGWVVEPADAEELARILRQAGEAGLRVIPRGGGTKLSWGNPPTGADVVLSTRRLDRLVEHAWADMTATVQAGCTVAALQQALAVHGQRLAVDPLWPERATIGGILAANDSGTLRLRFGSLRDLIIGITLALPDGTLAKSGGKVVKNVAGYDLPKLFTGSLGTLGVITEATFRLHPLPDRALTLSCRAGASEPAALCQLMLKVLDSTLVPTGVQLRVYDHDLPRLDVRFEGVAAEAQAGRLRKLAPGVGCDCDYVGEASDPVWSERESLWRDRRSRCVVICKVSVLSAQICDFCLHVRRAADQAGLRWRGVMQAVGVGLLRLEGAGEQVVAAVQDLRMYVERMGGSLVVLDCPPAVKAVLDVWGDPGDALALMRRVKAQFDPRSTLNPGRFVGGI